MKKFKAGQAIIFQPKTLYKGHPLKRNAVVHFLAYHEPAYGHIIVTTYAGKVITMLHPEDFRLVTEDEV